MPWRVPTYRLYKKNNSNSYAIYKRPQSCLIEIEKEKNITKNRKKERKRKINLLLSMGWGGLSMLDC